MLTKLELDKDKYRIELPRDLVESKGWSSGKEVVTTINKNGNIELKEISLPFTIAIQTKKK